MENEDFRCNIAVLGKTGVGKSSLLNYISGSNFKAGTGKPVTGEDLFEEDCEMNGQKVRVFDSWGIEPDKLEQWKTLLRKEQKKHNQTLSPTEWFHAIVYCINVGGARIENIDTEIISNFLKEGYRVVVALTQCQKGDKSSEKTAFELEKTLRYSVENGKKSNKIAVVHTCSVQETLRNGTVTQIFGKDALVNAILDGWKQTVLKRLPLAVVARLKVKLNEFVDNEIFILKQKKVSGNIASKINKKIFQEFLNKLETFIGDLFKNKYNEIVLDLIKEVRKIESGLIKALGIDVSENDIKIKGQLTRFARTVDEKVTIGEWIKRFISLGIRAIFLRFSKKAQNKTKLLLQAQFKEVQKDWEEIIKEQLPKITEDVKNLLG